MTKNVRLNPDDRAVKIMEAALKAAEEYGYKLVTRSQIASFARCSASLVTEYHGDMDTLRVKIMREAVATENVEIILQGLVTRSPTAMSAPQDLKDRAKSLLDFE